MPKLSKFVQQQLDIPALQRGAEFMHEKEYISLDHLLRWNYDYVDPREAVHLTEYRSKRLKPTDDPFKFVYDGEKIPVSELTLPIEGTNVGLLITQAPWTVQELSQVSAKYGLEQLLPFHSFIQQYYKLQQETSSEREYKSALYKLNMDLRKRLRFEQREQGYELPHMFTTHIEGVLVDRDSSGVSFAKLRYDKDRLKEEFTRKENYAYSWETHQPSKKEQEMKVLLRSILDQHQLFDMHFFYSTTSLFK